MHKLGSTFSILELLICADLLDELPEKRTIEDGGYLSDDEDEVFTVHLHLDFCV